MKAKLFLSAILILVSGAFNSCNKVASILAQSISWQGFDITIDVPASSDTSSYSVIGTGTFSYNLDSAIKSKTNNQLGLSNVDEFKFKSAVLTILNPDPLNNFANFEKASATFSTNANSTPVLVGEVTNNPNTYASTLTLPVNTTTNMRTYIPSSGPLIIVYDLIGKVRTPRTVVQSVQIHVEYDIHVTP